MLYALETISPAHHENHRVIPCGKSVEFLSLTYRLMKTGSDQVFLEVGRDLPSGFPNARSWLQWWLQPSVFRCRWVMKLGLRNIPQEPDIKINRKRNAAAVAQEDNSYGINPTVSRTFLLSLLLLLLSLKNSTT
ncbi:unnamed protein product [Mucor hiemalis]